MSICEQEIPDCPSELEFYLPTAFPLSAYIVGLHISSEGIP